MIDDNWGCVEPSELFSSCGKTQSLQYLVQKLQQCSGNNAYETVTNPDRQFPLASTSQAATDVEVVKVNGNSENAPKKNERTVAPKILKQKRGLVERPPSLKRVTFEVERFVVDNMKNDERQSAETRIAIRLGAVPEKSKGVNYKTVKEARRKTAELKKQENNLEMDQMPVLSALNKLKTIKKKEKLSQKKVLKRKKK